MAGRAEDTSSTLSFVESSPRGAMTRRVPALFLVLEAGRPLAGGARYVLDRAHDTVIGRGTERSRLPGSTELRVTVPDQHMSTDHARLRKVHGAWLITDLGSKNGVRVNGLGTRKASLRDGDVVELGHTLFRFRVALPAGEHCGHLDASELAHLQPGTGSLLPGLAIALEQVVRAAGERMSIVLSGESGTGKEVLARAIHVLSERTGRFVAVNCGALPDSLIKSELLGHRKGAFSGATEDRAGYVRSADGGTLLLDEIADLPLSSQPVLLRVLQEREVSPLGDTVAVAVDVRVIAATHKNLPAMVVANEFRADLFGRLAGLTFGLPPLRARIEDLGLFVGPLLRRLAPDRAASIRLSPDAARALVAHDWLMNIRELEKALSVALAVSEGSHLSLDDFPEPVVAAGESARASVRRAVTEPLSRDDQARKRELLELLDKHGGNVSAVARDMSKARMQIHRWAKRYGIDLAIYKG